MHCQNSFILLFLLALLCVGQLLLPATGVKNESSCAVRSGVVANLTRAFSGRLILPSDTRYQEASEIWNKRFNRRPCMIAYCASATDVSIVLSFLRQANLTFALRSGGHSATGWSSIDNGVVLDVSWINSTGFSEPGVMDVGAGATDEVVNAAADKQGLHVVTGGCPTVAIAFAQGGGYGITRNLGLAADNVLGVEVVLASGAIVWANATQNPDLFWALRGGGGGNFGVVTRFRLRMHVPPTNVLAGAITWPLADTEAVYAAWLALRDRCDLCTVMLNIARTSVSFSVMYFGLPAEGYQALHAALQIGKPVVQLAAQTAYEAWVTQGEVARNRTFSTFKSVFAEQHVPVKVILGLQKMVAMAPTDTAFVSIFPLGSEIGRIPISATAFWHRKALQLFAVFGQFTDASLEAPMVQWTRQTHAVVSPFSSGAYVNYPDLDLGESALQQYYGGHQERLRLVKKDVDPTGFFSFPQSIKPSDFDMDTYHVV